MSLVLEWTSSKWGLPSLDRCLAAPAHPKRTRTPRAAGPGIARRTAQEYSSSLRCNVTPHLRDTRSPPGTIVVLMRGMSRHHIHLPTRWARPTQCPRNTRRCNCERRTPPGKTSANRSPGIELPFHRHTPGSRWRK
eukprot:1623541-Rhodomonas_salina.4